MGFVNKIYFVVESVRNSYLRFDSLLIQKQCWTECRWFSNYEAVTFSWSFRSEVTDSAAGVLGQLVEGDASLNELSPGVVMEMEIYRAQVGRIRQWVHV